LINLLKLRHYLPGDWAIAKTGARSYRVLFHYLLFFVSPLVIPAVCVIMLLCQPLEAGNHASNFVVKMVSPQRFHIESLESGPVSSSLIGSGMGGNQSLITRQENGRVIIDAVVPLGAVLNLQVGAHTLRLRMIDPTHYQINEE
jgi:hypothetical protein